MYNVTQFAAIKKLKDVQGVNTFFTAKEILMGLMEDNQDEIDHLYIFFFGVVFIMMLSVFRYHQNMVLGTR